MMELVSLKEEKTPESSVSSPCVDMAKWLSANKEGGSHWEPNMLAP